MTKESDHSLLLLIAVGSIAFAVGYLTSDDSKEVARLRAELAHHSTSRPAAKEAAGVGIWKSAIAIRKSGPGNSRGSGDAERWPPNELFAKLEITKEDWDKTWELNKLRDKGEYILNHERPTTKKLLDHDFTHIVSQAAEASAPKYDEVFSQLGVSAKSAEQLKSHVAKIHRASLEAEVSIDQLLQARRDYDQRLHSIMNDETYGRYRQFEEPKPVVLEYEDFQSFVQAKNVSIDSRYEQALLDLIQQSHAYTANPWHGPFDGVPQPIVGAENVVPSQEHQLGQITEHVNQLVALFSTAGIPEEYKNLLASYYTEKVQWKKTGIEQLKARLAVGDGNR